MAPTSRPASSRPWTSCADPGWSNQVIFVSDGNPNEQTGTGGNSLADATATAWNNFVDTNLINVTTVGIGDGINTARLQDVDVDGAGRRSPSATSMI